MLHSPISYIGGKYSLRKHIIPLIPKHVCYCEAFAGGAWVLFGKEAKKSKIEVLNDVNEELINFYLVLKYKPMAFVKAFDWIFVSRQIFEKFKNEDLSQLSDVEKAMRFFYKIKVSYAGKSDFFPIYSRNKSRLNLMTFSEMIIIIHNRLKNVIIENMDFEEFISRYDKSGTFFYLDPPFYQVYSGYKHNFKEEDFIKLAAILNNIKGKFILSLNKHPYILKQFSAFDIIEVNTKYSLSIKGRDKDREELLIKNY
jgi:DNA adenine methylase